MLRIEHLTKRYGDRNVVDDLSIHILPGQLCAFIGHNGAGKTTTIKSCCGILQFDSGDIFINNISVKENPLAIKKQIAYIPDNPDLYEFLTGIQYLQFIADIYRVPAGIRDERVQKYAAAFGLTKDLAQKISEYSHGMKQKLVMISALIHDPSLIFMDEPFVGLDPIAARALKDEMRNFCHAGGTIFFSTHVLEVAEKLCDQVVIIRKGKLAAAGSMEEVKGTSSLEDVFLELEGENSNA